MTVNPSITFVCCVESGPLETQTLRMIESLRRWGGQLANAPIYAVTPRFGPPLADKTLQAFERLNVEYIRFRAKGRYSWKGFMNLRHALLAVEERSTSECIGWLDSDLIILGEPSKLILNEGEDFTACVRDKNMATAGPGDPSELYWKEICNLFEIDIEDLPWVTTEREGKRIRLHWNGGVFVYRRSTGFAEQLMQTTLKLFDARIAHQSAGIFFTQQTLSLTAVKMGLSFRHLPHSHNYGIGSKNYDEWYSEEQLREAKILHYHDFMWSPFWATLIKCLRDTHPHVADWLAPLGPLKNEAPAQWRVVHKGLDYFRSQKASAYSKSCRVV